MIVSFFDPSTCLTGVVSERTDLISEMTDLSLVDPVTIMSSMYTMLDLDIFIITCTFYNLFGILEFLVQFRLNIGLGPFWFGGWWWVVGVFVFILRMMRMEVCDVRRVKVTG
mgnify:CR=1 FL=1